MTFKPDPANLTRRRDRKSREEAWLIFYDGYVHVGTIGLRSGNPVGTAPWFWRCGFYPGSNPGDATSGTAADFEEARAAFESAWSVFLSKRTEADFQAYRRHRASDAWKRAVGKPAASCRLKPQTAGRGAFAARLSILQPWTITFMPCTWRLTSNDLADRPGPRLSLQARPLGCAAHHQDLGERSAVNMVAGRTAGCRAACG
jgi:hypothetical protein